MKLADYIAEALYAHGVRTVFELAGGMITDILDALYRDGRIDIVSMHQEQAAAFSAEALGRLGDVPGIALATSGPGATNLITGIASCYFDSTPAVFITGQVNRKELSDGRGVRQLGFQETDIVSMVRPVTKGAWLVEEPADLPLLIERAFALAADGRPGPVLLDVPLDVQRAEVGREALEAVARAGINQPTPILPSSLKNDVHECLHVLLGAQRPLILAGAGVRMSGAESLLSRFSIRAQIPVVTSLMGLDLLPYEHPMRVGMIGSYGNRWANAAVGLCDALLVIGSRLDIRQTGSDVSAFESGKSIMQVDLDPGEIGVRVTGVRSVVADAAAFLERALEGVTQNVPRTAWLETIHVLREDWMDDTELEPCCGINPNRFMHALSDVARDAAAYVADVGDNQMWAAQSLEIQPGQRFITSGGLGSMGFALPAAIGAAIACPGRRVVSIAGDGGMQMNIQELETVVRRGLPVKMVVLNNRSLGMVRQFQESYMEGRYPSTVWGYGAPDFERVASAFGVRSLTVDSQDRVEGALREWWDGEDGPSLLQVMIDTNTVVAPKMLFGHAVTDMHPPRRARIELKADYGTGEG